MQNTGKRCVILLFFIILRWSFNYESNVFRYNKILIDCVFGNSKFLVPSTLTINLGFASVNSQCLGDNKLAIPSYPVNKYILSHDEYKLLKNCPFYSFYVDSHSHRYLWTGPYVALFFFFFFFIEHRLFSYKQHFATLYVSLYDIYTISTIKHF